MEQAAYVWQRSWTPRLTQAIEAQASQLDGLTVLCAEIARGAQGEPSSVEIVVDWKLLQSTGRPITLALRIGSYSGPFDADAPMSQCLLNVLTRVLASARTAGLEPAAVEIDFDCATRLLEGYTQWLQWIRQPLAGLPLSITTLPTWMNRSHAFVQLVAATDHFVLQVHSIQRADTIDSEVMLCDPTQVKLWVQQAALMGQSFHVALPTYAYRLAYDVTGELVEVAAEDASPMQRLDWRYRVIRAEPAAMSSLVRDFKKTRPSNCLGLIWYRLPVAAERYNWDALTWRAVMAGQLARSAWTVESKLGPDGVVEIELFQHAALASEPPTQILVTWEGGSAVAWDGQRNYSVQRQTENALVWTWPENMARPLLPQGTRWTVGWLRMDALRELTLSIINHVD